MSSTGADQPELSLPGLVRAEARRATRPKPRAPLTPADPDPVAQVLVDVPLAHLDRPFDYVVPQTMAALACPGPGSRCASPARTSTASS